MDPQAHLRRSTAVAGKACSLGCKAGASHVQAILTYNSMVVLARRAMLLGLFVADRSLTLVSSDSGRWSDAEPGAGLSLAKIVPSANSG